MLNPEQIITAALADRAEFSLLCGHRADAIVLAEAVLARTTDQPDPAQLLLLARALSVIGSAHVDDARYDDAIRLLDALVTRFQHHAEPALREQVALALTNKVLALEALGLEDDALAVHADMVARFGEDALHILDAPAAHFAAAADPQVREHLAAALYSKARILAALGRWGEALLALGDLIARFQHDQDPEILTIVSEALRDLERAGDIPTDSG
jgi:tetratricopeptide (TPR) repeat protein